MLAAGWQKGDDKALMELVFSIQGGHICGSLGRGAPRFTFMPGV